MRSAFYEYYSLSKKEIDRLWVEGTIVFDTNVLLSLYRLSEDSREEILRVMDGYKNRLWIPNQVGFEYHENRLESAMNPIDAVRGLEKRAIDFEKSIKSYYSSNPYVDFKKLEKTLNSLKTRFANLATEWMESCPNPVKDDAILDSLTNLFEGKVGNEYDEKRISDVYKIGIDRYDNKIPPGYKDKDKPSDRQRYGDLIIWLQIIDYSRTANKDIIFVTDDVKEDWWATYKDDKLGPRKELIHEFRKETGGHIIWFYTAERFLSFAKDKMGASVKSKTLDEIKRPTVDWISAMGLDSVLGEDNPLAPLSSRFQTVADALGSSGVGVTSSLPSDLWKNSVLGNKYLMDEDTISAFQRSQPPFGWLGLASDSNLLSSLSKAGLLADSPVGSVSGSLLERLSDGNNGESESEKGMDDGGNEDKNGEIEQGE